MAKEIDARCGIHYDPCPFGGDCVRCSRCNGDGEVAPRGKPQMREWIPSGDCGCPKCGGLQMWVQGGKRTNGN